MKKLLIGASVSLMFAAPAMAQVSGLEDDLVIELNGQVAEYCGITGTAAGADTVDFNELSLTPTSTNVDRTSEFGMVCNAAGGIQMTITSTNGALQRVGSSGGQFNEIPYSMNPDTGGDSLPFTPGTPLQGATAFTSGKVYSTPGGQALLEGRQIDIAFRANGVQGAGFDGAPTTTVFAGDYQDTVTIAVVAQ